MPFQKTETIAKLLEDPVVNEYISSIGNMSKSSLIEYITRLNIFNTFLSNSYGLSITDIITKIKEGPIDSLHNTFKI